MNASRNGARSTGLARRRLALTLDGNEQFEALPPREADFEDLLRLFTTARVVETLGGARSAEQVRELLERWRRLWASRGFGPWIVRRSDDGRRAFAGYAGLARARAGRPVQSERSERPAQIELLYAFDPAFWGSGLATCASRAAIDDAAHRVGLEQLVAYTLTSNLRSRRVIERLGFHYEREGEHAGAPHAFYRLDCARRAR